MAQKILIRQLLIALTAAWSLELLKGSYQPAHAEMQGLVIELPVYGQAVPGSLTAQAELLVSSAIERQFKQNPGLSTIQVVVTGDRNGEIIPILTTTASRAQWQANPQVKAWTKYYSASYALLQRHEQKTEVAVSSPTSAIASSNLNDTAQIDAAFDSGVLTGQAAQKYLNDLD
ncbi:hypothetical protein H6F86_24770 [Phormidium sp. FACHB-592]|uniref:Uncharacterized protein n=1 Tax=Stenomitos frigidus AS-A4 TaxID=2933935 RepID=A0ABV0KUD6_9CYAN|nr:hypothetical protein [Phormidium sp. FACHB-592]MBD2077042.1 hypothetical protein [Phormidium sp. FACHB-592]